MSEWKTKRFWDAAVAAEAGRGFTVHLDNRPLRTPAKAEFLVPTMALARSVAAEWDAQNDVIDPLTMPFTRSSNAAIDKVQPQFDEVAALVSDFGNSDLLCYRATEPEGLVERQAQAWDPLLKWADTEYGANLVLASGLVHVKQPGESVDRLGRIVRQLGSFELTALHDLVSLSGSLVIGLAALRNAFDIDDLWRRSRVDEDWQTEIWGEDEEALEEGESRRSAFVTAHKFAGLAKNDT